MRKGKATSLPISSAEIASTIEVFSHLSSIAFSMPARMPVTNTVSSASSDAGAFCATTPVHARERRC